MNKLCVVLSFGVLATVANADVALRKQIQGKYDKIAAVLFKDSSKAIPEMAKMLTSDFVWIDPAGNEFSSEPYLGSQSRNIMAVAKVFGAKNEMLSYKEDGIYVRCRIRSTLAYRRTGFSTDRHQGVSVSDDVWVKTIHGWKMYKSIGISDSDRIVFRLEPQRAAVMTARMTSAGVVQPAAAFAFPSSSMVR